MTKVMVNGNLDGALKKFKAKVAKSGIPSEIKKRKFYKKPGVVKREQAEEARKNARKHRRG